MKNTLYLLMVLALLLTGTQSIAGHATSSKNPTIQLKTQDNDVIRCDVHAADVQKLKGMRNEETVKMSSESSTSEEHNAEEHNAIDFINSTI